MSSATPASDDTPSTVPAVDPDNQDTNPLAGEESQEQPEPVAVQIKSTTKLTTIRIIDIGRTKAEGGPWKGRYQLVVSDESSFYDDIDQLLKAVKQSLT
jgi:hypothetical protein